MSDTTLHRETAPIHADRGVFGIQEDRSAYQNAGPSWLEMQMDNVPVRIGHGAVRFRCLVGTHRPTVTIEVSKGKTNPPSEGFELIGSGPYQSLSGEAHFWSFDGGPYLPFTLRPDSVYDLHVWRKGGDTAQARYEELVGVVYPIVGLEEYLVQFVEC